MLKLTTSSALVALLSLTAISAAHANALIHPANTEAGYTTHAVPDSGVTRAEVRDELQQFRNDPVGADGARFVGGDIGWVYEQHGYARSGGHWVHADRIDHRTPAASRSVTPDTRLDFRQNYPGG